MMAEKTINPRQFKQIPIFVVSEHHDVLKFIYSCAAAKILPIKGVQMIHFDAHSDMGIPRKMPAQYSYNSRSLLEYVSIESWITPNLFTGLISHVVWIRPSWVQGHPEGSHEFLVGEGPAGTIKSTSVLDEYVCDGTFAPEYDLTGIQKVQYRIMDLATVNYTYDNFLGDPPSGSSKIPYILDIDLDYFYSANPFEVMFKNGNLYDQLKEIFCMPKPEFGNDVEKMKQYSMAQEDLINDLHKLFTHLDLAPLETFPRSSINLRPDTWKRIEELYECAQNNYSSDDLDWIIVFEAGCTQDHSDEPLPHHLSTNDEIKLALNNMEKFLRTLPCPPTIVTVARSTEDDYCTEPMADQLEEHVVKLLQAVYGDKVSPTPIRDYNKDPWDVCELSR